MRSIAACGFVAIAAAAATTIWLVAALRPTSASAVAALCAWLVAPHAVMAAALLLLERNGTAPAPWHAVAIMVCAGGVLVLADLIFWHTDAQGALAVLMTPVLQGAALIVMIPLAWWGSRRRRTQQP